MSSGEKIKQILYSVIEEIGRENIQLNISSNIMFSQKYIDIIMNRCITRLTYESDIYDHSLDIIIAVLCEALLHFMLTISSLPSERKVEIKDVIQIIRDKKTDLTKVKKVEVLQPNSQNIWCISPRPLSIAKYTEYSMFPDHRSHKYSNILTDIDKFLNTMNVRSFRFIP